MYNLLGCEWFVSAAQFYTFSTRGDEREEVQNGKQVGMRMERGVLRESAQKRLSYRPTTFSEKLQKSREI